ncbi:MAG: UDP-N-acetylmuramoylalanine--D-glutamate ligase [Actinomycetota bacterium]
MSTPSRRTALVHGLAVTGAAVARQLLARGWDVVVSDDRGDDATKERAASLGLPLVVAPDADRVRSLVENSDMVCPAPGVPESHVVCQSALAAGVPLRTEIDLAYEWEQERPGGARPMLGVTGTDGKTTTTLLTAHLLGAAGIRAAAVGNTETPVLDVLDDDSVDAFVVECSSFRLHWTEHFRCESSVWLNLAPDHQNWHVSMESYEGAKARMWAHLRDGDVAIGHAADPVVMRNLRKVEAAGRAVRTFGAEAADYRRDGDWLVGPQGRLAAVADLPRSLPHDVTNSLAALAVCLEARFPGLDAESLARGLSTFRHPPHRIEPVGEVDGVRWFNDSKATSPHAALTAIRGFENIVLLAGGRNKGLDLASLATESARIRAVVCLGESAAELVAAFEGVCPTVTASSMDDAVDAARSLATPGDVVLLSPACASFDWYPTGGYPARGEHFTRLVRSLQPRPSIEQGTPA